MTRISPSLAEIIVYPVKSIGGLNLSRAWVERQGLAFDRRFMLAQKDGTMITARQFPQLFHVSATLIPGGICLTYPGHDTLVLIRSSFVMEASPTNVFKDTFLAWSTTEEANRWFSAILNHPVQLLFTGEQSNRVREAIPFNISFADGYPLLILSEASLAGLNERSDSLISMDRFRPNLIVTGAEAFEEDSWKRIRIGEVEFVGVKPCVRCVMTTLDPVTARPDPLREPLLTLSRFRADEQGNIKFGHNLVAMNEGVIRVGDTIQVLEVKPRETFVDRSRKKLTLVCVDKEYIAHDFCTFWFTTADASVLPVYQPGQHLPLQVTINGRRHSRRYTLSSSPSRPDRFAISVRRVGGGLVSGWLHNHFQVGDTLRADLPSGEFYLDTDSEKLLLLAAGSGLTPMLSMLRYLSDRKKMGDVVLWYQCRSREDIACQTELETLQHMHPSLTIHIVLSQPDDAWSGETGRLDADSLNKVDDLVERQVYVCGPEGFMQTARAALLSKGLPQAQYHQEAFTLATVVHAEPAPVSLTVNGVTFEGDNQSPLLPQAELAGIPMPHSCRAGFCGSCKVRVLSGKVSHPEMIALTAEERKNHYALACCCVPLTPLEVGF